MKTTFHCRKNKKWPFLSLSKLPGNRTEGHSRLYSTSCLKAEISLS